MKVELHFVRRNGIKIPDREGYCEPVLRGNLEMRSRWVSATRALPALELCAIDVSNGEGVLAVLYEPKLEGITSNWIRFSGFEVLKHGNDKQLVVQDWRCYLLL